MPFLLKYPAKLISLAVNSSSVVNILLASSQTVRSTGRVVFIAHANPALRATLSQDSA